MRLCVEFKDVGEMEFQRGGMVKTKALPLVVWYLASVKEPRRSAIRGMATEEIGQAPGGEVVQSFTGDDGDLEVDVLLYEELVCVIEDRSW